MAAPDEDNVYRVPGRLIKAPTDLASAPAYGGTILGAVKDFRVDAGIRNARINAWELARTQEVIIIHGDAAASFVMREWEKDPISALFPGSTSAGSGARRNVDIPSTSLPSGSRLSTSALCGAYLFVADRVDEHPSALLFNAIPLIEATEVSLRFSVRYELGVEFFILGLTDGSGRAAKIGRLGDLTL